jgi:phage shock protein A
MGTLWLCFFLVFLNVIVMMPVGAFRPPLQRAVVRHRLVAPQMNFVGRFFRVVAANINSILRRLEDPEKIIEQAVADMQNDLVRIRTSYAEIAALMRRAENRKAENNRNAEEWHHRAQQALRSGDENLAREALSHRQTILDAVDATAGAIIAHTKATEKLYSSMVALEAKIAEAKRQKETLIARARTAKTAVNVNDLLSNLGENTSTEAFERMKEKVESLELQAEAAEQLATGLTGMDGRFKGLDVSRKVQDELNRLRQQLPRVVDIEQLPGPLESTAEYEAWMKDVNHR